MDERRKLTRQRTFKGGIIMVPQVGTLECVVRNLTPAGACLDLAYAAALPEGFALTIKPETVTRSCAVVWRSPTRIGVRFNEPS